MKKVYLMAVIAALIAGIAAYYFTTSVIESTSIENAPTQQVYVITQDIPSGSVITMEMAETSFTKKVILLEDVVPEAVTDLQQIVGRVATQKLFQGEQASMKRFMLEGGDEANLSFNLAEGEVAYTIKADADKGVDGYVVPGDTVNIVAWYDKFDGPDRDNEDPVTILQFEDLEVLKVATYQEVLTAKGEEDDGAVKTYVSLTIKTTKQEAEQLWDMERQTDDKYKVVLNSHIDTENLVGE